MNEREKEDASEVVADEGDKEKEAAHGSNGGDGVVNAGGAITGDDVEDRTDHDPVIQVD